MNEFNEAQRVVLFNYDGGIHSLTTTTIADCAAAGDGLFNFLMIELSSDEGCHDIEEASRRVDMAIRQLLAVAAELEGRCS